MGLLDSLGYGGGSGNGGLLDFLLQQPPQNSFSGLPSDQAQYGQPQPPMNAMAQMPVFGANQPSPLDTASWPAGPNGAPQQSAQPSPLDTAQWPSGPVGAPSQANAQMIPQQPPPVIGSRPMQGAQPSGGQPSGFFDRLNTGLQSIGNGGSIIGALTGNMTDPATQQRQVQNQTLQALIQKGVDPQTAQAAIGNPELLKTLITQAYGPQTVTPLGNGYVADKSGKITRAYEPDDKIPAGFEKTEGGLRPIAGGPADPAYLRLKAAKEADPNGVYVLGRGGELYKKDENGNVQIIHKNAASDAGPEMSDEAIDFSARRAIAGDTKALTGLGHGAQGRATLVKINERIAQIAKDSGIDAKGILSNVAQQAGLVSSARALGTKETHFGVAEKAMEESLPLAQAASDAVPRSDWIHLNKLVQMGQTEHSNPLLKRFLIATDTAAKDYARTINPTGALRESDIEYARKILSTADGPESYTAALDQLRMEAGVMHRAIGRQKGELYGKKDETAAAPEVSRADAEAELRRRGKIK